MTTLTSTIQSDLNKLLDTLESTRFAMVAFDMDGTLLNEQYRLSERTIQAVQAVAAAGIRVLLATGRMNGAITEHLEKLGTPSVVVSHNGALVSDVKTNEIFHHQTVPSPVVDAILAWLEGLRVVTHFNMQSDVCLTAANPYSERYAEELGIELTYVSSFQELQEEPTSVLLLDRKETLLPLLELMNKQFSGQFDHVLIPWFDDLWMLQFLPPETSKGKGVLRVAERLGVTADQIISFGDSYNDLEMIASTGLGIAMGNAVDELKQVARFVTASHAEDGVAIVLEGMLQRWNR